MSEVSSLGKAVARELVSAWGVRPQIASFLDDDGKQRVDIADTCSALPDQTRAVGTVSLSGHDLGLGAVRVEVVGAFLKEFEHAANIAATVAFNAFKDGVPARPDAVHPAS